MRARAGRRGCVDAADPLSADQGGRERIENGIAAELLERPAPAMTQAGLICQIVVHLNTSATPTSASTAKTDGSCSWGSCCPTGCGSKSGGPSRSTSTPGAGLGVEAWRPRTSSTSRCATTDGVYGLSPIRQARVALGLSGPACRTRLRPSSPTTRGPSGVLKPQALRRDRQRRHRRTQGRLQRRTRRGRERPQNRGPRRRRGLCPLLDPARRCPVPRAAQARAPSRLRGSSACRPG